MYLHTSTTTRLKGIETRSTIRYFFCLIYTNTTTRLKGIETCQNYVLVSFYIQDTSTTTRLKGIETQWKYQRIEYDLIQTQRPDLRGLKQVILVIKFTTYDTNTTTRLKGIETLQQQLVDISPRSTSPEVECIP